MKPVAFNCGPSWRIKPNSKSISNYANRPFQQKRREFLHHIRFPLPTFVAGEEEKEEEEEMEEEGLDLSSGPKAENEGTDVIVIHPGSTHVRVGFASSSIPATVAQVIARRMNVISQENVQEQPDKIDPELQDEEFCSKILQYAEETETIIKTRMKEAKLRSVPNSLQQVQSFNSAVEPEKIADHNDPYRMEWVDVNSSPDVLYGDQALLVPFEGSNFRLFHPIVEGELNTMNYASSEHLAADIAGCWTFAIEKELQVNRNDFGNYAVMLLIPDMFEKSDVLFLVDILMNKLCFRSFSLIQESVAATFGAGISTACVVDVGSQKTSIACIEDGYLIPESRINLKFGGDDITKILFYLFHQRTLFPYRELRLSHLHDFFTIESLKEHYCTLHEEDITVHVYDCYIRTPRHPTLLFKFKIYDEAMAAPMAPFFPQEFMFYNRHISYLDRKPIFGLPQDPNLAVVKHKYWKSASPFHIDYTKHKAIISHVDEKRKRIRLYTKVCKSDNAKMDMNPKSEDIVESAAEISSSKEEERSKFVEKDEKKAELALPLDNAIVISIASTSPRLMDLSTKEEREGDEENHVFITNAEQERFKRMFTSILLVGGGLSPFPGSSKYLQDHLFNAFHYLMPELFGIKNMKLEKVQVLANPRDIDPQYVSWKGGAIASRLELVSRECWISSIEWEAFGQILLERLLFQWS